MRSRLWQSEVKLSCAGYTFDSYSREKGLTLEQHADFRAEKVGLTSGLENHGRLGAVEWRCLGFARGRGKSWQGP